MKKDCTTTIIKLLILLLIFLTGCKKFVDVPPPATKLTQENVYANDATASAVLTGMYSDLQDFTFASTVKPGLSADELRYYEITSHTAYGDFYVNGLNAITTDSYDLWTLGYKFLNVANAALEGLNSATALTPSVKQQLTGEALFMRAYLHLTLVNLFGDIPLVTTSDYRLNSSITRTSREAVLAHIISDLQQAQSLLGVEYRAANVQNSTSDRVRPNQAVATALLARAYLYTQAWAEAEKESTKLITNTSRYELVGLNEVFLVNSKEAIWQVASSDPLRNTIDGLRLILNGPPDYDHPVGISSQLLNAFETDDQRRIEWIGHINVDNEDYYYPFKYKVSAGDRGTENLTLLRLAEQLLIRAEARVRLSDLPGAREDLNAVRRRAGLSITQESDPQKLLEMIYHERQVELFTESGHRWIDLKRTGKIDQVMTAVTPEKGGIWKSSQQLYPIPQFELDLNRNLTQNSGY